MSKNNEQPEPIESAPEQAEPSDTSENGPQDEPLTGEQLIEQLQQEKDDLFARLQRATADYQNYIRRNTENLPLEIRRAEGDLLKRLIPVLDHFDNALAHEPTGEEARSVFDGMRIVRDELMQVLRQCGVSTIEPAIGDTFDPHRHEAMLRQPAEGVAPNRVSMVMQVGYRHDDRTLRPAKVAVAPEECES